MKYNGMDIHWYNDGAEIHLSKPAFKNGQRVRLTEKGKRVQKARYGHLPLADDFFDNTFYVTNVVVSVTVNAGRKEQDSNIEGGRWHYGVGLTMDAQESTFALSVESDEIEAVDNGGAFTMGVVMEDTVDEGESLLKLIGEKPYPADDDAERLRDMLGDEAEDDGRYDGE